MHRRDFICDAFGASGERHHREFKAFFPVQNDFVKTPKRERHSNWKLRPLIKWVNFLFPMIWALECTFSVDEIKIRFKGNNKDKKRITHKEQRNGFQVDAL